MKIPWHFYFLWQNIRIINFSWKGSENAYISQMDIHYFVHADVVAYRVHNAANQALLGSIGDCNLPSFSSEDAVRKNSRRLACDWNPRENF